MRIICFTLASWFLLLLAPRAALGEEKTPHPNILIILADDMGYGDVGVLNPDSRIPTPHLDRLAEGGLIFTDAHAAGSYCVPSRYGLLTGRYMWRTRLGSGGNLANLAGTLIEPGRKTIADLVRGAGYHTGLVGKWHQGIDWKLHDESVRDVIRVDPNYQDFGNIDFTSPVLKGPNDYGFDYSFGTAGSAEMNPATFLSNNRVTVIPTLSSEEAREKHGEWYGRDDNIVAEGYTMDRLVPTLSDKACEFVETATRTRPDQPFFLYYAMTTPHNPIVPNPEFVGKSRAGAYGDFVVELDHHVGRILSKLAELGIEKNTLVLFTSDNGPVNRTKGYQEKWVRGDAAIHGHDSNGPFSGWKAGLQEGGHRVPFFVRWPETIEPGGRCATTIVFTDVLPTLAELLNLRLDDDTAEDGVSFYQTFCQDWVRESTESEFRLARREEGVEQAPGLTNNTARRNSGRSKENSERSELASNPKNPIDLRTESWQGVLALTGGARPESFHEAIVHNHSNGTFAIRQGSFKLTVNGPLTTAQLLDDAFPVSSFVLHDLGNDIEEANDVSGTHPERVKAMHALLKKVVREGRSSGSR